MKVNCDIFVLLELNCDSGRILFEEAAVAVVMVLFCATLGVVVDESKEESEAVSIVELLSYVAPPPIISSP